MYDVLNAKKYDYIHGKTNSDHTLETNNMVFGIDEYLPEDRRNRETEFIAFKKYYQRIQSGNGIPYHPQQEVQLHGWNKNDYPSRL